MPLLDEKLIDRLWNSGIDKIAPKIAVDNGNHSNYLYGDEVVISANVEGGDTVEILREGKLVEEIRICAKAVFLRKLPRGYYTVRLKNDGAEVAFAVCQPTNSFQWQKLQGLFPKSIRYLDKKHDEDSINLIYSFK